MGDPERSQIDIPYEGVPIATTGSDPAAAQSDKKTTTDDRASAHGRWFEILNSSVATTLITVVLGGTYSTNLILLPGETKGS